MHRSVRGSALFFALTAIAVAACDRDDPGSATSDSCSESFYRTIEEKVQTGDGQGHGPDVGSDEWKSVVEFELGVRGDADVPERDSEDWCRHIDRIGRSRPSAPTASEAAGRTTGAGSSFACEDAAPGSIEVMICGDEALAALDRRLAGVYAAASGKATDQNPPVLAAEQRGWIKGRDECWKNADPHGCVRGEYARRIAELQASYRLVPFEGRSVMPAKATRPTRSSPPTSRPTPRR
jgi:uncharacterized protein YecT (DUF1311 family)